MKPMSSSPRHDQDLVATHRGRGGVSGARGSRPAIGASPGKRQCPSPLDTGGSAPLPQLATAAESGEIALVPAMWTNAATISGCWQEEEPA